MATKKQVIKLEGTGYQRVGINGRVFTLQRGVNTNVEPELAEHLRNSGIAFTEVSDGAAAKEGSVDAAPTIASTVIKPAMAPRSLDDSKGGDQSGDVTSAGSGDGAPAENAVSLAEEAKVSDLRVAAERQTKADAPAAEKAGEGEGGAPKAKPLPEGGKSKRK